MSSASGPRGPSEDFIEVILDLLADLRERPRRRARQLELTARFQRDRGVLAQERDRLAVFLVFVLGSAR